MRKSVSMVIIDHSRDCSMGRAKILRDEEDSCCHSCCRQAEGKVWQAQREPRVREPLPQTCTAHPKDVKLLADNHQGRQRANCSDRSATLSVASRANRRSATSDGGDRRTGKGLVRAGRREHATHEPLIRSIMVEELPLAGRTLARKNEFARAASTAMYGS
jgi:hypothetical protein